jgi:hypothetical protein
MSVTLAVSNGDLDDNARGAVDLITGRDKLSQDIAQALLSEYDYTRDTGGKLASMKLMGPGAKALIVGEVTRILNRLKRLQEADQYVTDSEKIASIGDVSCKQLNDTDFQFYANVLTVSGHMLSATDTVSYRRTNLSHTYPSGLFPLT